MYRISKRFAFEAAHRLLGMEPGHPCGSLHGHSYRVEVIIEADALDDRGFAGGVDYRDFDGLKLRIDGSLDHATILRADDLLLQDEAELGKFFRMDANPTAENIAAVIHDATQELLPAHVAAAVAEVRVSETAKTWASYRPG